MPIDFRCPDGHKLSVSDTLAGRKARCPLCRQKMYIPEGNFTPDQIAEPAFDGTSAAQQGADLSESTIAAIFAIEDLSSLSERVPPDDPTDVAVEAEQASAAPRASTSIYTPDRDKVQTARLLAVALALTALFTAGPVLWHGNLSAAADWVRVALLLCTLQLAYVAWMASVPDWATVWVAMLVHALIATVYGAALAIFLYAPLDAPLSLGLSSVARRVAIGWCLSVVLITTLMTFACGRVCAQWRRADEWKRRRAAEG